MPLPQAFEAPQFGIGRYAGLASVNATAAAIRGLGFSYPGFAFATRKGIFQLVQNRSGGTLAAGDSVSLLLGDASRTGNLTSASTPDEFTTDDTHDSGLDGNDQWPGHVFVTAGALATTADMAMRQIRKNTVVTSLSRLTIAFASPEEGPITGTAANNPESIAAVDNTYDYSVFCPWEVVKTDADALVTQQMQGVVISTSITDDYFGIIQTHGVGLAKVDGTTDCPVGTLLVPDAAAGVLRNWVITDNAANTVGAEILNAAFVCARILDSYTNNAAGLRGVQLFGRHALIPQPISWA